MASVAFVNNKEKFVFTVAEKSLIQYSISNLHRLPTDLEQRRLGCPLATSSSSWDKAPKTRSVLCPPRYFCTNIRHVELSATRYIKILEYQYHQVLMMTILICLSYKNENVQWKRAVLHNYYTVFTEVYFKTTPTMETSKLTQSPYILTDMGLKANNFLCYLTPRSRNQKIISMAQQSRLTATGHVSFFYYAELG